ncbi:50S ribosomal protein L25/general stress protein Ctc [bacterium]|nr:50S ribosomal protein L25/general stress protein Ctc [bacterium]
MSQVTLNASVRDKTGGGASYQLRTKGFIPATYYGKGENNLNISVNPKELEKAISGDLGTNTLINLKVEGKGEYNVLLKDYQAHPIKRHFTHADFIKVDLTKKIRIAIPVHLTGRAVGVKEGGILEHVTREITVSCLPTAIPKEITVDITELKIGHNLHLSNLKLPEGVEAVAHSDLTIASVVAPREEEVVAAPVEGAAAAPAEPEVTKQKAPVAEEAAGKDGKAAPKKDEKKK